MYQEIILDHYKHPHHRGLREPFDAEVHHVNPTCGDEVTLRVRWPTGDRSPTSRLGSVGCSISQASTSVMTRPGHRQAGRARRCEVSDAFLALMQSQGQPAEADEDVLEDAVAFAGVVEVPGAGQVRAAGLDGDEGAQSPQRPAREEIANDRDVSSEPLADVDDVEEAMRDVVDPELGINVVDLGLVYGLRVDPTGATPSSST